MLTGNQAVALGASAAGLDAYFAYPMTPSTSILHFAAENSDELGLKVVQPENEIAVANMAVASAYAGARTMVGTSGGGFALMQETVSLAGMSETPLLLVECQRAGPSTGVPTYTAQGDLEFAVNSGHGEFPLVVLAPRDAEEAFSRAGEALDLAWRYQVPVVLLSDKHLAESRMTADIDPGAVERAEFEQAEGGGHYDRYSFTDDGVSPLAFPGDPGAVVKATSYEHTEHGYTTEDPGEVVRMQDKRKRKGKSIESYVEGLDPVNVFGEGSTAVLSWGSTVGAVLDAVGKLEEPVKVVQPVYLRPFPSRVSRELERAKRVISVEGNATGQLSGLLRRETGVSVDGEVLKYDMRPFDPDGLAERLGGEL